MENFFHDASSVMTVISFLTFIGILYWTFSGRRTQDFEAAANLPFDEDRVEENRVPSEKQHG